MKLIIFKETGEVRCPKKGEWFKGTAGMIEAQSEFSIYYPIYKRIEIEVPARAKEMIPYFKISNLETILDNSQKITFHHPKVKKWLWYRVMGGIELKTTSHHTEKEMVAECLYREYWHKLLESEIEVEEY